MPVSSSVNGRNVTITVTGRFDFSSHKDFRETYANTDGASCNYIVDMSNTEYIDSSALGMLLLLREFASSDKSRITLKGASADVKDILVVSNFDKLFTLE